MTLLHYTFSLTSPPVDRHPYHSSEFHLELPSTWQRVLTGEVDAMSFQSLDGAAALVVSADFLDTPADEAHAVAEQCLASRIEAHRLASAVPLEVIQQAIRPHASGALEMSYATQGEHVHLYLGYVTTHKVLNFSMACPSDRRAAMALFNATVPHFRPRLP